MTLLVALASAAALAEAPRVEVVYANAARFADVRNGYTQTPAARDAYLGQLRQFIEQRASPRLAEGEALRVTITNVNLAGDYYAQRPAATNVRIVREVTPARIDLVFRVSRGEKVVREGTRMLRSAGYPSAYNPTDRLNYEKALIDDWLADEFPR